MKPMKQCEVRLKIVCNTSKLKQNNYRRENGTNRVYCDLCNNYEIEYAKHIIRHCTALIDIRDEMFLNVESSGERI